MRNRKIISFLLVVLMCVSLVQPALFILSAEALSDNAYATIFAASDFQGGSSAFTNFASMVAQAKKAGYPTPDGAFFGGDYTDSSNIDPLEASRTITSALQAQYPDIDPSKFVFVQGNHDGVGDTLSPTGFHAFDDYVVYSINEDSYKASQSGRTGYASVVQSLAADVKLYLDNMIKTGDRRPVFVMTHVPLHHSSRSSYGDNLYSKYLFDVLNEAGSTLDIVFLFGHNHSSSYDNYIGGSVNYMAPGDTIRIPIPDTASQGSSGYTSEALNFTYMNYGYVGYSGNSTSDGSTNVLTMSAIELCPSTIEISRYGMDSLYTTHTITLKNILPTTADVQLYGSSSVNAGYGETVYSTAYNIENPTFTWSTSDSSVAEVYPAGENAFVFYKSAGNVTITLSASGADGASASDSLNVVVTAPGTASAQSQLLYNAVNANGRKLKFYEAVYGTQIMLDASFSGFSGSDIRLSWASTNPGVASVENGLVTLNGSGDATIYYTVSDGSVTLEKSVDIFVSRGAKPVDTFVLTSTIETGKEYAILSASEAAVTAYAALNVNELTGAYNNYRLAVTPVQTLDINGVTGFTSNDDRIVWEAVAGEHGELYLKSPESGKYLYTDWYAATTDAIEQCNIELRETPDLVKSAVTYSTSRGLTVGNYRLRYSSDGNIRTASESSSNLFIYERIPSEVSTSLTANDVSVAGTIRTIYSVNAFATENLKGTYANFGETVSESWISSDTQIATVNASGFVSFTGAEGRVDITYLVTDTDGHSSSKTVTYVTTVSREPVRVFKPAMSIEPGKSYTVLSSKSQGAAYVMNNRKQSSSRLSSDYVVVQIDTADNLPYIEIPEVRAWDIWTASASPRSGYYYLTNDADGSYLWSDYASFVVGSSPDTSTAPALECYYWDMLDAANSRGLVNCSTEYSGFGISYSESNTAFRAVYANEPDWQERSNVYIFEEIELVPSVHIRSNYENIENSTVSRREVCAWQTETFLPRTVNFSTDNISYTWTSSNPEIASVDSNGVITYTGAHGNTTISLTATANVPDSDGSYDSATASTVIRVANPDENYLWRYNLTDTFIPGEIYAFSGNADAGIGRVMDCRPSSNTAGTELRLLFKSYEFLIDDSGAYFDESDLSIAWECIASDTEGSYYFKNAATGQYLALSYANGIRACTVSNTLEEFAEAAYLIRLDTSTNLISSVQSRANSNYLSYSSSSYYFRLSGAPKAMYIYQRSVPSETLIPSIEIRMSAWNGSENITNRFQTRNEIYSGQTERLLSYITSFDTIESVTWSSSNENIASIDNQGLISYTGQEGIVSFTLTVTGTDFDGNTVTRQEMTTISASPLPYTSPTDDYPEYPGDGSVRINKTAAATAAGYSFQTSGVTEIELSVTGVPMTQPVDVVIVFDHSSSMNSSDRLINAIDDTKDFAIQLVNKNPLNRLAIVTFDRFFNNFRSFDAATPTYSTSSSSNENRIITGDGTATGAFMTKDDAETLVSQIDSLSYNNTAGTNYDDGLERCYEILEAAKNDPNANEKQYVIFMSDGEPYVYNRLVIDYADEAYTAWLSGNETNASLSGMLADPVSYPVVNYFNTDGNHWIAEAIKAPEGSDAGLPAMPYYDNYRTGLGATLFSIGYSTSSAASLTTQILKNIASSEDEFFYAETNLQNTYDRILDSILYAANRAVVTDIMGEDYDLQFAASYELGNGMATINLNPAPYIEFGSWTLNSDGTRNEYIVFETITFETNANSYLTAAYSNLLSGNIYDAASNTIKGRYVSYDLETETFTWTIGDITREEVTLKYYAYLTESAEGDRPAGIYNTNEAAKLNYFNYLGNPCEQIFPIPALGWHEAAVNYEFYYVNELGQPVNSAGVVVPFSERVLVGNIQTKNIFLNTTSAIDAYSLIADEELPAGYQLFNPSAAYKIWVSSGDSASKAEIVDSGASVITTYFYDGNYLYNNNGEVPDVSDYTNTHVAFAVLLKAGIAPDSVVIDYGLPVKIHPLANDISATAAGAITGIATALADSTELHFEAYHSSRLAGDTGNTLTLKYGTAVLSGDIIIYTPNCMTMSTEDVLYYEYRTADGVYFYTSVTVIPAANIYYEESFFTFKDSAEYKWTDAGQTYADKFQSEDRPGTFSHAYDANNVYGSDDAYSDSVSTYSLGSAKKTFVDRASSGKEPTAEFTFCGTGFDLFSVTAGNTGAVKVEVYDSTGKRIKNYTVQTYYGYSYDEQTKTFVPNPDSSDSLYQVPVIRARNLGYGSYRVLITPKYAKVFDMHYDEASGSNGYEIYVDSVRIYDPAGALPDSSSVVGKAYIDDSEAAPEYVELRSNLLDAETFYNSTKELDSSQFAQGIVFIDGIAALDDSGLSDNYLNAGPNNELYLAKGQAVAFHISSESGIQPETLQLGMKVVQGGTATLLCMNANFSRPNTVTVNGSSEMYRRFTSYITWDQDELAKGVYKTKHPIIIMNNSDSIVALTSFKWTWKETAVPEAARMLSFAVTSSTPALARAALNSFVFSEEAGAVQNDFNPDEVLIQWSAEQYTAGDAVKVSITTPTQITGVRLGDMDVLSCEIDENGNKLWTLEFTAGAAGEYRYALEFFDSDGNSYTATALQTLSVQPQEQEEPGGIRRLINKLTEFIKNIVRWWRSLW